MSRKLVSTGSIFEKTAGYSRAVVQGNWCFVSGTTGYNYLTLEMPESVEEQCINCLQTIEKALSDAGFSKRDIIKAGYHITNCDYADIVFPILGKFFDGVRPAATMVVSGLIRPEMKIEIEVTALKQS